MNYAFLQTNDGRYYSFSDGKVVLASIETSLHEIPEVMNSIDEINSSHRRHLESPQTGFIFRMDGKKILRHLFLSHGIDVLCYLIIKGDNKFHGELDFTTFKSHHSEGEDDLVKIACIHL